MKKTIILLTVIYLFNFSYSWCENFVECPACGFKNNIFFSFCIKCGAKLQKSGESENYIKNTPKILRSPFTLEEPEIEKSKLFVFITYKGKYEWMDNQIHLYVDKKLVGTGKLCKSIRDSRGRSNPFRIRKYKFECIVDVGTHDIRIEVPYHYQNSSREKIYKISVEEFTGIKFSPNENKKLEKTVLIGEE